MNPKTKTPAKKQRKESNKPAFSFPKFTMFSFVRFSVKEQTLFAKRLSFLINAGVPMLDSLHLLKRQVRGGGRVRLFERIISDVSNGQFLSTSLARFRGTFGDFAINIIRVGEQGGVLSQNLNYLAEELKKKHEVRRKVLGALIYPIFITIATLGLTVLLTAYIFPKVMPIFASLNVKLPLTTRILIVASDVVRSFGFYILGGLAVFVVGTFVAAKSILPFRYFLHALLLRLPLFSRIVVAYNMTNICRTLGLLLRSGTRVVEAVHTTADTTANLVYRHHLHEAAKLVMGGGRISKHLELHPRLFPDIASQMIMIGETSGNLSETLIYISEHYEHELDDLIKSLSSMIEPILMVFMGIVVGFVAVSIITPIYQVTQNLSR